MRDSRTALFSVAEVTRGENSGAGFVIGVSALVVAGGIALWPDAPDRWILPMWIAAATVSGLGLTPVRAFARALVRRLWSSAAGDPYTTLASFLAGVAVAGPADDAVSRLARLVATGTGAQCVTVYLSQPAGGLRFAGQWPPNGIATNNLTPRAGSRTAGPGAGMEPMFPGYVASASRLD